MTDLTTAIRTRFRAWSCSYARPGWRAIGTMPDGRQIVTGATDSPEDALRALLEASCASA